MCKKQKTPSSEVDQEKAFTIFIELKNEVLSLLESNKDHITFPPSDISFAAFSGSNGYEDAVDRLTCFLAARTTPRLEFHGFDDVMISEETYRQFMGLRGNGQDALNKYESLIYQSLVRIAKPKKNKDDVTMFLTWLTSKISEYTSVSGPETKRSKSDLKESVNASKPKAKKNIANVETAENPAAKKVKPNDT
jgi:hypothetical protein